MSSSNSSYVFLKEDEHIEKETSASDFWEGIRGLDIDSRFSGSSEDDSSTYCKETEAHNYDEKLFLFQPENRWNVADCNSRLFISKPNCTTVQHGDTSLRSTVRAELMIPRHHCGIFYFEVKIIKISGWAGLAVGLAPKEMALEKQCAGILKNSYAYECNGNLWGHHFIVKGSGYYLGSPFIPSADHKFHTGDTVGCGVNLANRQIIYTLNGTRLKTTNLFVYQPDLYPCVSIECSGDTIEANFGPDFLYGISAEFPGEVKEQIVSQSRQPLLICPKNRWNSSDCSSNSVFVIRPACLTAYCYQHVSGFKVGSVRAELMLPRHHCGIFYFEVKIVKLVRWLLIGLAEKSVPLAYNGIVNTYGYTSIGEFSGHFVHGCEFYKDVPLFKNKDKFTTGDVVGCGLNLATRQIIYTLNGKRLDTTNLLVHQCDLFPFVSFLDFGDKVTANFGPQFEYAFAEEYLDNVK